MLPDWVSNPGPLTYESGALPIALRGPAKLNVPWLNSFPEIISFAFFHQLREITMYLNENELKDNSSNYLQMKMNRVTLNFLSTRDKNI